MDYHDLIVGHRERVLDIYRRRYERLRSLAAKEAASLEDLEAAELEFLKAGLDLELARLDAKMP